MVLVVAVVGGALWWSLPEGHARVLIPGLSSPVHVGIDSDGVPRIVAANALDAAAALGFMHARDRMMQMDLMRRVASGRLSELVGPTTLRLDRYMRVLGLRHRAERDVASLDGGTAAILAAYANGVNAWIDHRGRFAAPEMILVGKPEAWTPVDSLLWGKTMALYLSGNWQTELARATTQGKLPPEQARDLWPPQSTLSPDAASSAASRLGAAIPRFPEPFTLPETASNEWAVDGTRSLSGAPLLAGDPHLAYSAPGIWYLARVETPEGVLAGATAPGVPFLVLGHNGHIAWTFTTAGADTQDVFVETVLPDGRYATPSGALPFAIRHESIAVRGSPDVHLIIRETRHGPVVSDLDPTPGGAVMAVAMAESASGDTTAAGLLELNHATSVAQAGEASARMTAPVQNLLVADGAGIALFTTGRVPIRRAGDGTIPRRGDDGAHDWTGFAGGSALPRFVHPASGVLLNANERTVPPNFPVFMGQDWFGDWRARRIRTMLAARPRHSAETFAAMQVDTTSAFAQAVLPRLLQTPPRDDLSREALASLHGWSGEMTSDTKQPFLFNAWMRLFAAALLASNNIPAGLTGAQPDLVAHALSVGESRWCGGDCTTMLADSLAEASRTTKGRTWGSVHDAVFAHPVLGRIAWLGRLFTFRVPQPGDGETLFRGAMRGTDWDAVHGAAFRGVYDLADLDRSLYSVAPGQSGHPLRRGFTDLLPRWLGPASIRLGPDASTVETVDLSPAARDGD